MTLAQIVPYAIEHVKSVAQIEAVLNPVPWSEQLFADELEMPSYARHWLVAAIDGEVVGYAGTMFVEHDAHLMNIGVGPADQRKGIARALMVQMMNDVRQAGLRNMTLEVRPDNLGAIALYRQFGFAPEGMRKGYYPDGQDAMIMWLHGLDSEVYGERIAALVASAQSGSAQSDSAQSGSAQC